MILAGWADLAISPGQQMCLIKTDSMGCDGTEWTCDVSYLEELAEKEESGLKVYPNPTKSTLFVELKGESEKLKVSSIANVFVIASEAKQSVSDKEINFVEGFTVATSKALAMTLSIEQFNSLPIDQKLKYSSKNPNNTFWTEKEEQEMRELSRKFAYALPFEVIKGKVDIFAIDPALAMRVESEKLKVESIENAKHLEGAMHLTKIEVIIYDIFGREVSRTFLFDNNITIDVSNLQKGVYFVQVGENVAKFVKE